ncbi:hypothetical protein M3Y94_00611300 [Aphelenchoides besseyi]|nr:hypothetical protein M3Y94_00611300 [Aphelenchoides besseyi]
MKTVNPTAQLASSSQDAISFHSPRRFVSGEVTVDLPQLLKLVRSNGTNSKTPLERLEKQICCRFDYETLGWNEFRINMFGTDVGLRKGHEMLTLMIKKPPTTCDSTGIFPFMSLPLEVQRMIVNQVDWKESDGRALLPLRLVNRRLCYLVDHVMEKGRRCFKKRICLAETTNAKSSTWIPAVNFTRFGFV